MSQLPQRQALPDRAELERRLAAVLDAARKGGATAADAGVSVSRALTVNVRNAEVESVEFQRDRDLSLTVHVGQRSGSASTSDFSDAGLASTVDAALAIARASGEDPYSGLADAELMATEFPDLDLFHPWDIAPEQAIEIASECEAAARAVDARITRSEGAGVDTRESVQIYGNTHGFIGERRGTSHQMSCSVIAEADGMMQRDYWYSAGRVPDKLDSAESIGRRAGERTVSRLGAKSIATRQAPVLFVPEQARGLFGHFTSGISGSALYRKTSFLLDKLGEQVFSPIVNLSQRPFIKAGPSSAAFDQEGVATRERELIENGVIQGWLLSSYSARRLGLQTTGNAGGTYNLLAKPGEQDFKALLRDMGEGFVVTELMGQGVNLVTGDYSRGAAGFWVENGEIAFPVREVTIAGNLLDMFAGIAAIGSDVDTRGGIQTGSVLIDRMTIAGG